MGDVSKPDEVVAKIILKGDLSQLSTEERVEYYRRVCDDLKLSPLTKPFQYLRLSGREVLYATKNATEQLRGLHGVSVTSLTGQTINGVHVVTATGSNDQGRTDAATGAVDIEGLKGDNLANALMKAETKAKRRLTLSICGLGMLDETEIETIPDARTVEDVVVDRELGDIGKAQREMEQLIAEVEGLVPAAAIEAAKSATATAVDRGDIEALRDAYKSLRKQRRMIEREEGKARMYDEIDRINNVPSTAPKGFGVGSKEQKELEVF